MTNTKRHGSTLGWTCIGIIGIYLVTAFLAPVLAPHGESQIFPEAYAPWDHKFPLGTDQLGRDMLSRLVYGARNTIGIAALTTALSCGLGISLGLFAALLSGWTDALISRAADMLMSVPHLIFTLILLAILGTSTLNMILVIALLDSAKMFRLARAVGMDIAARDYIEVARLRGEHTHWILWREVLPNAAPPLLSETALRFCFVFLTISTLSFLGLGIQPPTADWGSMVRENATLIGYGDITPLLPATAIGLLAIGVNLSVDWLFSRRTKG